MAQVRGGRFGNGAYITVPQLPLCRLKDLPATAWTIGQLMHEFGYHRSWLQDYVFLDLDVCLIGTCGELFLGAMWAYSRSGHRYRLVNVIWFASPPGRVTLGSTPFSWRSFLFAVFRLC